MFENTIFFSSFWDWFIIALTLGGIVGVIWLIIWVNKRPAKGEKVQPMGHVWDGDLQELNNPLPMWWLNMFYITIVFGLIYLALYPGLGSYKGLLGWTSVGQYEQEIDSANTAYGPMYDKYKALPIAALVKDKDAVQIGQRLFMTYCTVCHGSDAGGNTGFPNLRDHDWLYGGEPEMIETSIKAGRQGVMPAWEAAIGKDGVKNVAQYVLTLSGRAEANPAAAEKGKTVFATTCAACHGPDGKGMAALGAPNLTDKIWLYGGSVETIEKTVAEGRQGKMPAHGEFLGDAKVHLLAAYVYSLSAKAEDTAKK
jgi:cytochrome c oxidase cbb3-type subunit 3